MARPNPLRAIMGAELPSITYQRKKSFRPTDSVVDYTYKIINQYVFDNQLRKPEITLSQMRGTWGYCEWLHEPQPSKSNCRIKLSNKWFCPQWFVNVLAHEMVHQYQWDVYRWEHIDYYGRDLDNRGGAHGPSFYEWRDAFAHYGLDLKISHGQKRWFRHQTFTRC